MIDNSGILLEKASHEQNANWLLLWIMALVLLFLFIRLFYSSYWKRYRLAMLFPVEAEKLLKEKNINILQAAMSLNLAASLSISLFLFLLINYQYKWDWPSMELYDLVLFTGLIVLVISLRYASVVLLGNIFNLKKLVSDLNHYWLLNLKNGGFYLLICSIVINYIPQDIRIFPVIVAYGIVAMLFILNALKSIQILRQYRVSLFYGILYLCTLEILPVVMITSMILS